MAPAGGIRASVGTCISLDNLDLSHSMIKPTLWPVYPAKIRINLGMRRPVWSESSLCGVCVHALIFQVDMEDWSDCADAQAILFVLSCWVSFY